MSHGPTLGGKIGLVGLRPVEEIGQTCGLNVIMRREATSNRSVVTAAIGTATGSGVASGWKTNGRM